MSFVHLHVHSEYSLLDGFSNIEKLVERAKAMGMPAIGLTDHGTMFGVIDFYKAATKAGIKPIVGVESYLAPRGMASRDPQQDKRSTHILLLAENQTGYLNLLQIASAAQLEGFYYYPRIDHEFLAAHSEGLICTSGCMSAEVPRLISNGDMEGARRQLDWYYETFGRERFFLELQAHDIPELDNINKNLIDLGRRYEAQFVATNDVHYIDRDDARLQDIMLAIQTGCVLKDPNRMRMTDNTYYLRSPDEMGRLFSAVPEALNNSLLIAERCNVDLGFKGYHLPQFEVPAGHTAETYLRGMCENGLEKRYGARQNDPVVRQRLDYELSVIHTMGFDTYFLIVWDLCRYAREHGIWYNARGSAAGSMVAYTLDITMVDPIEHGLIFERFLNPGRISMPDIDLDFRDDRRAEMIQYTARKYGDDKVAQIITFGTLGARAAIRDVGRVMEIPLPDVDRVAKMVPNIPGKPVTIDEALDEIVEFKEAYKSSPQIKELIDTASKVEGVVRNAGTHAAGVIITDRPVIEYIPLHRPTGSAEDSPVKTVTQFEMSVLESLGLLKVDFLGLDTLTIMARACQLILERKGIDLNLGNIPVDDPATYELLGRGDTAGVFQVEGSGMRRWLLQMKPKELANVVAMVALFRPGPMDFIPGYIRRMHGEEQVEYRHPELEPIFKETYGYPVYQEQLMFAAMRLAGYSAPEADDLRKAISKKMKDKLLKHKEKFVHGAVERGIQPETAEAIFADWEEFARYGFNKCLPGDVEIVDAETGRLVKIEDLYQEKTHLARTLACETGSLKLGSRQVLDVVENGVKPVFRLTTLSGRSIEATGNHPFYTYGGWRNLEDLKPGSLIAVPRVIPVEGRQAWPEHEVIALGHLLAEGNLCHPHSVYFYNQDPLQVADFVRAAEKFENVACSIADQKGTTYVYARRIDRKSPPGIFLWARQLDLLGKTARQKEIPAAAFLLPNEQVGLLLSRLWQGDGHIDTRSRCLFYATASEKLARQVQHLLLRLGVLSQLRQVTFPYKEGRTGYQLFVTGNESLKRFRDEVGAYYINPMEKGKLQEIILAAPRSSGTRDIIPMEIKTLVRAAKDRSGATWEAIHSTCGVAQREFYPSSTVTKRGYTRRTIGRLAEYFHDPDLAKAAANDIYWDEIASITYAGEKQTYDLEIEGDHNFIANDFLVHNSHAVDYGVLSVQTAYLKVHYPVEYMTAVLSARKNETEKVALYVADCRKLGIPVEPPDINSSSWDFSIEDREDGKAVIRFGLGAVKNVGQGPVEAILKARAGGPFRDLNDLARRVDMRQVGRRALDSLVKVGALDRYGDRPALLETLDRLMSISTSHFKAKEIGQMSMFSLGTGVTEELVLAKASVEISRREILNWERDLIGLYVSDHPLSRVIDDLDAWVSHYSGQLGETTNGDRVRVAGLITRMRHHQSKAGKPMGFATIEDMQGNIELVIFPRTWEKVSHLITVDRIILVDGKVDLGGAEPKVLVDSITTEFSRVTVAELPPVAPAPGPRAAPAGIRDAAPGYPAAPEPEAGALEDGEPDGPAVGDEEMPPPPEPPEDWAWESLGVRVDRRAVGRRTEGLQTRKNPAPSGEAGARAYEAPQRPSGEGAPVKRSPEPALEAAGASPVGAPPDSAGQEPAPGPGEASGQTPAAQPALALGAIPGGNPLQAPGEEPPAAVEEPAAPVKPPAAEPVASVPIPEPAPRLVEPPVHLPPFMMAAAPLPEKGSQVHMITVVMRSTGDKIRDGLRLRRIYGIFTSYPGSDRFAFQVYERGRGYLIEFPNDTCGYCPELIQRLAALNGPENVRVEPITFH